MTRSKRSVVIVAAAGVAMATPLLAIDLPRSTLWGVEQTCVLNQRTTGSPYPCLKVDRAGGYAILRAPFRQTHIVLMPLARISGIESALLRRPGEPNYFAAAWQARSFVAAEVDRPLSPDDIGLAVNSVYTRSQDQLHIHVDCLNEHVKRRIAARVATFPTDGWLPDGLRDQGQSYAARRIDQPTLDGVDPFALADELPAVRDHPGRTTLAVAGARMPGGQWGFVLLVGQSNPDEKAAQSTGEDLLDHQCRRGG